MNYRHLSDNDLIDFAANLQTLLTGSQLSAIDTNVRASFAAALDALPDRLSTELNEAITTEGKRMAAVSQKNTTRGQIISIASQIKHALNAGYAPKEQYDLCSFDFRKKAVGTYQAQDPTELSSIVYANGINKIKFKGNNSLNSVVYEIWRRQGAAGVWTLHGTTTKQSFTDMPVVPGRHYEYKVRAKAARTESNFSNVAVVYGMGL